MRRIRKAKYRPRRQAHCPGPVDPIGHRLLAPVFRAPKIPRLLPKSTRDYSSQRSFIESLTHNTHVTGHC